MWSGRPPLAGIPSRQVIWMRLADRSMRIAMGLSREKIVFADMLRGVACLAVVVEHYGFVFWSPSLTLVIPNVDPIPAGTAPPSIH
jgi:hypothetical protein